MDQFLYLLDVDGLISNVASLSTTFSVSSSIGAGGNFALVLLLVVMILTFYCFLQKSVSLFFGKFAIISQTI